MAFADWASGNQFFLNDFAPQVRSVTPRYDVLQNMLNTAGGMFGGMAAAPAAPAAPAGPDPYKQLSDSLLGQLSGAGDSQREKITQTFDTSLNSALARLRDRGFGNSSLVETTTQANDRNRQSAMTELEDALLQQRVGVQQNVGLAGLAAQQQRAMQQQQLMNQMIGGFFGGMFG